MIALRTVEGLSRFLNALWLFTRSDVKNVMFPITAWAYAAISNHHPSRLVGSMLWVWIHLLHFNVANQYHAVDEDRVNKPHRPIPSNKISQEHAAVLRWALWPVCLAISAMYGRSVLFFSLVLLMTTAGYNELELSQHWFFKHTLLVGIYAAFDLAPKIILGLPTSHTSAAVSCLILLTTVQIQDFPDISGDLLSHRRTIPIAFPKTSRLFTAASVIIWSLVVVRLWALGWITSLVSMLLGAVVAWRTGNFTTPESGKRTVVLWNAWLFCSHVLPINSFV